MAGTVRHLIQRGDAFWARIVVPVELRPIVGKSELRQPLGSIRREAERRLHAAVAGFHVQLDKARRDLAKAGTAPRSRPARPLSLPEIARTHYAEELATDERDRDRLGASLPDMAWSQPGYAESLRRVASGRADDDEIGTAIGWAVDRFSERGNLKLERGAAEWRNLARTLAMVQLEAIERAAERDRGDFAGRPKLPVLVEPAEAPAGAPTTITGLLEGYLKGLRAAGKGAEAERRWTPCFRAFVSFLKHDDARRVTKADVVRWRDALLETKAAKTVRDSDLGSLRAVFQWAVESGHVRINPAQGVKVKVARPIRGREKGFTLDEAKAVLKAARDYQPAPSDNPRTRESAHTTAAKRWVPGLCAFTGARVAEMTQLRREDVRQEDGRHVLRITPDAGSVKTGEFRDVPLHPQLVELGFLAFVEAAEDGPLFFNGKSARDGKQHASKQVAGRLSKWVRDLDVVSLDVDPNHGWRHRFKTLAREEGIDPRVADCLQGHAPRTAGDDYGDITLKAKAAAIGKLPRYELEPAEA